MHSYLVHLYMYCIIKYNVGKLVKTFHGTHAQGMQGIVLQYKVFHFLLLSVRTTKTNMLTKERTRSTHRDTLVLSGNDKLVTSLRILACPPHARGPLTFFWNSYLLMYLGRWRAKANPFSVHGLRILLLVPGNSVVRVRERFLLADWADWHRKLPKLTA